MFDAALIALIVFAGTCTTVVAPLWFAARQRKADWARQDVIEARRQAVNEKTNVKLDRIHTFVNSDKTQDMKNTLVLLETLLGSEKQIILMTKAAGHQVSKEANAAIRQLQGRIEALRASIRERERMTLDVDAQVKTSMHLINQEETDSAQAP